MAINRMGAMAITRTSTKDVVIATAMSWISLCCTANAAAIPPKQAITTRIKGTNPKRAASKLSRNSDKAVVDFVFVSASEEMKVTLFVIVFIMIVLVIDL